MDTLLYTHFGVSGFSYGNCWLVLAFIEPMGVASFRTISNFDTVQRVVNPEISRVRST